LSLLMIIGISRASTSSTKTAIEHEEAARQLFGALANNFQKERFGEVFDLLHAKWEKFYPGMITSEQAKEIRTAFVTAHEKQAGERKSGLTVSHFLGLSKTMASVQEDIERRINKLDNAGEAFIRKALASFPTDVQKLSGKLAILRADFDTLGASTKKKIVKHFVIFDHLDELCEISSQFWLLQLVYASPSS
ncbi:hypothetical protein PMAYCL1PPCAC_28098, partial [Pristionchus mayeri]